MNFLTVFLECVCRIARECYQLTRRLFWWSPELFGNAERQNHRKSGVFHNDFDPSTSSSNLDSLSFRRSSSEEVRAEVPSTDETMCFKHGQDVKPKSDIVEIMGFDSATLKLVLESFVDEVAEESAELILERPRFVHAVVVMTGGDAEPLCQAACIRQLDKIQIQESVQAATPDLDDFMDRIVRDISESRDMLDGPRYSESLPSSPKKMPMPTQQPFSCQHTTNELLHHLDSNNYLARPTRASASVQFPSMNRSRH